MRVAWLLVLTFAGASLTGCTSQGPREAVATLTIGLVVDTAQGANWSVTIPVILEYDDEAGRWLPGPSLDALANETDGVLEGEALETLLNISGTGPARIENVSTTFDVIVGDSLGPRTSHFGQPDGSTVHVHAPNGTTVTLYWSFKEGTPNCGGQDRAMVVDPPQPWRNSSAHGIDVGPGSHEVRFRWGPGTVCV